MKYFQFYINYFKYVLLVLIIIIHFLFLSKNLYSHEKLYITLTSWKGRINLIHKNLENLLNNKIKPKKIILNLAIEEFPKKNSELPKEILNLLYGYKNFEIFWVEKNNNVFKKLIPTINRFKKDLILTVDDDISYPYDCIEKMIKCYYKLGGKNPVSFGTNYTDWNISGKIINSHFGAGSIVKYEYFNNKLNEIYLNTTIDRIQKNIKCPDDILYTYAALLNGKKKIRCKEYSINLKISNKLTIKNSFSENYSKNYTFFLLEYHNIIKEYIKRKYNITIIKLIQRIESKLKK